MCICMLYVKRVDVNVRLCMYVHVKVRLYVYAYVHVRVRSYAYAYVDVFMCVRMSLSTCARV